MIDHVSLLVTDWDRSLAFYLGALAPLGYEVVMHLKRSEIPQLGAENVAGLGAGGKPDLWLAQTDRAPSPVHLAFLAQDRGQVDAFHAAGLAAGGRDNGGPGPRPIYHPAYYGAFLLDPDGHNIEAVIHNHKPS